MRLGYDWHRKQAKEHPELLEWVLRENYFGEMRCVPDVEGEFDLIPALE